MADATQAFPSAFMKADDLLAGPQTVTIKDVNLRHEFNDGSTKPVIEFGDGKSLVCNKTNWNLIIEMYGTNTDAWLGKPLTLTRQMVDFQGKRTPAIRINPTSAPAAPATNGNGHTAPAGEDPRKASATALKLWVAKARRQGAAEPTAEELSTKADELAALCYGANVADPIVDKFLTAPDTPTALQAMWDAIDPLMSRLSGDVPF
jgi:hypothetical protein